jgi:transposase
MTLMARPSKYPTELPERAVRMVLESRAEYRSEYEAIRSVASKLGVTSPESLRKWVRQAAVDGGARPGKTTIEIAEIKALKKEIAELRRANAILKSASSRRSSTAHTGSDRLRLHKEEFGVEPICRVLSEHGTKIAPSTYYDTVSRDPSKRAAGRGRPGADTRLKAETVAGGTVRYLLVVNSGRRRPQTSALNV